MRQLSSLEKWSYAVGNMPFSIKDAAFVNFVVFYYTQVQGLSGTLAGLAMFIALVWDAVTDPIVGSWSDTFRSRWGRRHPLLVIGGIPTALLFLALFDPPDSLGQAGQFAWLLIISILLRTFLTIYFIPYSAMGAELSTDYDERTVIAKARVTMGWLAAMLLPAVGFLVIFQPVAGTDGRLVDTNYVHYGALSCAIAGATALMCIWGTRTVIPRLPQPAQGPDFHFGQPIADLRIALTNRNFKLKLGASLAFGMAVGIYSTLAVYMGTYFWEFSSDQLAGLVFPTAIATLLAFVLLNRLGQRFDKPTLLCGASLLLAFDAFWMIGARLMGLLPDNGHPLIYSLQLLNTGIGVFAIVTLHVLSASILADILDEQDLKTGRRQEGVFFAANTFISKSTTGLGSLLAGLVIDLAGVTPGMAPGAVEGSVLELLGWFTMSLTCILTGIAFAFYRRIHMSREDHRQVRRQLQQRPS